MRDLIQTDQPLWLPQGSVRAIIALLIVAVFAFGTAVPIEVATLVLGFYFGQRSV